jgi:hypothetical protein
MVDLGEGYFGYARKDNVVGDNPGTPGREVNAVYGHLVIDNDMVFEDADPVQQLQVTAAHELHHIIQFGYDGRDQYYGFYEGGAVWMQNQVYPPDPLMPDIVAGVFEYPDVCIGSNPPRDGFSRFYGEWLMIDSIARDLTPQSYEQIWEKLILDQGLTGFYNAVAEMGTTPQAVIQHMAIRNLLHDYEAADNAWTTVKVEATVTRYGDYRPRENGVEELGVDYVYITGEPGMYSFEIIGRDLSMTYVGIDGGSMTAYSYDMGRAGVVDTARYTYGYVIILNTKQHIFPDDCTMTDWTLRVSDGRGFPQTRVMPDEWGAWKAKIAE